MIFTSLVVTFHHLFMILCKKKLNLRHFREVEKIGPPGSLLKDLRTCAVIRFQTNRLQGHSDRLDILGARRWQVDWLDWQGRLGSALGCD